MFGASLARAAVAVLTAGRDSVAATAGGACCTMLATTTATTWKPAIVPFLKGGCPVGQSISAKRCDHRAAQRTKRALPGAKRPVCRRVGSTARQPCTRRWNDPIQMFSRRCRWGRESRAEADKSLSTPHLPARTRTPKNGTFGVLGRTSERTAGLRFPVTSGVHRLAPAVPLRRHGPSISDDGESHGNPE